MNWNNAIEGELKGVLQTLQNAFAELQIDYFVIGAVARDIWNAESGRTSRRTKDIDFAVFVGKRDEYEAIKQHLIKREKYRDTRTNSFVLLTPGGVQVDILPFGGIENDGEVRVEGKGLTKIRVEGMLEVFETGTKPVIAENGREFQVASLAAITLLKLIAYDDRPEVRQKDAGDIANILQHFFDLQAEMIYDEHKDLFDLGEGNVEHTTEEVAAIVVGREIKKIIEGNSKLLERVQSICAKFRTEAEGSAFVREMMRETARPADEVINLLQKIRRRASTKKM